MKDGLVYSDNIESTKITSEWYSADASYSR